LKVLFVIDALGAGGAERSLADMLPGLSRAHIQSKVVYFHRTKVNLEKLFLSQGADLHFLDRRSVAGRVAALRQLIRSEHPDVVHTTLFESNLVGRLAAIGRRTIVVTSLVNTPYDSIRHQNSDIHPLKFAAVRLIDALTSRYLTHHFHAISEAVKDAAVNTLHLSPERITTIERGREGRAGAPGEDERRKARLRLGLSSADEVIVNVGRQEYQKGQRYLVEAMVDVVRRRPRAVLLIAGRPGHQSAALEQIQRNASLGSRIRLLGHREDVPDVLASADIFAFPSLYEGLGGALIEAMASGLPIVASRIPATECVVEEGGNALLVERAWVRPLANAIVDLLDDRGRRDAFGRRSRQIFEERFTLDRCTGRMVDFYRRLAGHTAHLPASRLAPELH
jgi:glycosyltransferase involved in cell wall biosynthesis